MLTNNDSDQKLLTLLGFAQKAKKVISGDANVRTFLKKRQIKLLIVADDISNEAKERWQRKANEHQVPTIIAADKKRLGLSIGQSPRAIIGLLDDSFAKAIKECRMDTMKK